MIDSHADTSAPYRGMRGAVDAEDASEVLLCGSMREIDTRIAVESFESCEIEVEYLHGYSFHAIFNGAILIPFGGLLRLGQRPKALERYRSACRNAAERAAFVAERQIGGEQVSLPRRLSVSVYFSGDIKYDSEDLAASCKFLLDGFRITGMLNPEDPQQIASFDCFMQRCGQGESPSVGMAFRSAYKS